MQRSEILELARSIMARQGKKADFGEDDELAAIGFRSLDFSELALRYEMASNASVTFDAAPLRAIRTMKDAIDFLAAAAKK